MVHTWSPGELFAALQAQHFGTTLGAEEGEELMGLLQAWIQRALGLVTLRDAIWVDPHRGIRVYSLICRGLTVAEHVVPSDLISEPQRLHGHELVSSEIKNALISQSDEHETENNATIHAERSKILSMLEWAEAQGLTLAYLASPGATYPFAENLDEPVVPRLVPYEYQEHSFERTAGWRRIATLGLIFLSVLFLGLSFLGRRPSQTTRVSLALFLLAVLVGVRAGWMGYSGAFCIWLVVNLLRSRQNLHLSFWQGLLLPIGVILLAFDRPVRGMWRWIMKI
jgi:hypothetical protein